jgi:hypothetical protein
VLTFTGDQERRRTTAKIAEVPFSGKENKSVPFNCRFTTSSTGVLSKGVPLELCDLES